VIEEKKSFFASLFRPNTPFVVKDKKFQKIFTKVMMEMTAGYPGQSSLPIKMMAMSDVDHHAHRRNSNRHPPVSATYSTGHGSIYDSNGEYPLSCVCVRVCVSNYVYKHFNNNNASGHINLG
jgi:hypothetical protein